MSRPDTEGFSIMDVSTAILDDPKFLRLALHSPELYADGVVAFVSCLCRSWSKGRRVTVTDAWPVYRPFRQEVVDALIAERLVDRNGRVLPVSWREWFETAAKRRDATRERNRNSARAHRDRQRTVSDDDTSVSALLPSVRPSVPTDPPVPRGRMTSFADGMKNAGLTFNPVPKPSARRSA